MTGRREDDENHEEEGRVDEHEQATEAWLEPITLNECLELLRAAQIGRVAVVIDEFPIVVPVNYTFVEASGRQWFALRTRAGVPSTGRRHPWREAAILHRDSLGSEQATRPGWNYVTRTRDEITGAHRDWSRATARFGRAASRLARMDNAEPAWASS